MKHRVEVQDALEERLFAGAEENHRQTKLVVRAVRLFASAHVQHGFGEVALVEIGDGTEAVQDRTEHLVHALVRAAGGEAALDDLQRLGL